MKAHADEGQEYGEDKGKYDVEVEDIRDQGRRAYLVLKMMEDRVWLAGEEHPVIRAVAGLKADHPAVSDMCESSCGIVELLRNKNVYRSHFITPDFVLEVKKREVFNKRCKEQFEDIPRANPDEKVVVFNK